MTFEEITAEEFRDYLAKSPYKSFMQTPEIARYRERNGWTAYYLAAKDHDGVRAASMLVAKPTFMGKSTFIAPGGPLLDLENHTLTDFFIKNLKQYIKTHNGYLLQISPYYEIRELDRHGDPVPDGFNHQSAIKKLQSLGFIKQNHPSQPEIMYALDINGQTPEELMQNFKSNTRGHIRKAEKMGVTIRELKKTELGIFKKITESTSIRRDFEDKPLEYYENMYDLFVPRKEAMFLLAELREQEESSRLPLSAAMFILYGSEVVYLFSGSDERYMRDYNAQYAIQWYMIKYAAKHRFKRYNFYGIHGLPNKDTKDGVYEFKKGFGGQVLEYIGTWELPIDQKFYQIKKLLSKLKNRGK